MQRVLKFKPVNTLTCTKRIVIEPDVYLGYFLLHSLKLYIVATHLNCLDDTILILATMYSLIKKRREIVTHLHHF